MSNTEGTKMENTDCTCCGEPNEDAAFQDAAGNWVCGWCLLKAWNEARYVLDGEGNAVGAKDA